MSNRPAFLSVVVPVRNGEKTLGLCLEHLFKSDLSSYHFEVILIDNGSKDQTVQIAKRYPVRVISEPRKGRSIARNRGWKSAQGKWIAFVDSDTLISSSWFSEMLSEAENYPHIGAVSSWIDLHIIPKNGDYKVNVSTSSGTPVNILEFPTTAPSIDTAACIYRKEALAEVGGFDEALYRLQDIDLSRRVAYQNWNLLASQAVATKLKHADNFKSGMLISYESGSAQKYFKARWGEESVSLPRPKTFFHSVAWCLGTIRHLVLPQKYHQEESGSVALGPFQISSNIFLVICSKSCYLGQKGTSEVMVLDEELGEKFKTLIQCSRSQSNLSEVKEIENLLQAFTS